MAREQDCVGPENIYGKSKEPGGSFVKFISWQVIYDNKNNNSRIKFK